MSQVTMGLGFPKAVQVMVTLPPSLASMYWGGVSVKVGGAAERRRVALARHCTVCPRESYTGRQDPKSKVRLVGCTLLTFAGPTGLMRSPQGFAEPLCPARTGALAQPAHTSSILPGPPPVPPDMPTAPPPPPPARPHFHGTCYLSSPWAHSDRWPGCCGGSREHPARSSLPAPPFPASSQHPAERRPVCRQLPSERSPEFAPGPPTSTCADWSLDQSSTRFGYAPAAVTASARPCELTGESTGSTSPVDQQEAPPGTPALGPGPGGGGMSAAHLEVKPQLKCSPHWWGSRHVTPGPPRALPTWGPPGSREE